MSVEKVGEIDEDPAASNKALHAEFEKSIEYSKVCCKISFRAGFRVLVIMMNRANHSHKRCCVGIKWADGQPE
ncbi:MAG: hypothetical protein ABFS09_10740 [Thermodesulfobacteriota bacterium]